MTNDAQIDMLCEDNDEPAFIGKNKKGAYEIDIDPTDLRVSGMRRLEIPMSLFWLLHHATEGYEYAQRLMGKLYEKAEQ